MNKKIIAGVAPLLASIPTASVFAVTGTSVTDSVAVTINVACSITVGKVENTYAVTMTNSQLKSDIGGTSMSVSCNNAGGWKLSAVGYTGNTAGTTTLAAGGSGTSIATGTATSGATSNWAFKVTGTGATGYTTFKAVPSTAATVATQSGSVSGASLTATYQVWTSATQQADTYTGKVRYTLANPA